MNYRALSDYYISPEYVTTLERVTINRVWG